MSRARDLLLSGLVSVLSIMGAATMSDAAESNVPTFIKATQIAPVGDCRVGVMGVYGEPLRAKILVAGSSHGSEWESTHVLVNGQELAVGDAIYTGSIIPNGPGIMGGIGLQPTPENQAIPPGSIVLDSDGQLRLDGPDVHTATDLKTISWQPDETNPNEVLTEWWPAIAIRGDTGAPADPHTARLSVGSQLSAGKTKVQVVAIQGATKTHPARLLLQVMPGA